MRPLDRPKVKSLHLNSRRRRKLKKGPIVVIALILALIIGGIIIFVTAQNQPTEIVLEPKASDNESTASTEEATNVTNQQAQYDIDTPTSETFVINKQRTLASDYVPSDLVIPNVAKRESISNDEQYVRQVAATALETMTQAAAQEGIELILGSGYRSYTLQESLFASYEAISGTELANEYSARAGQSEHQTGLAVDLVGGDYTCYLETCFEETPAGQWLAAHAHEYGFILRFMKDRETITGYQYEPWHFRYVGVELATEITEQQVTLEEYFQLVE
ncbi:MAG: M15 family metallopeptidase [Culicoidibacterales bacterium]